MPGDHELKPLPFAYDALEGITEQVTRWHHDKIYSNYVEKRNEIERKLESVDRSSANPHRSEFNDLKRNEARLINGMCLHQLYYEGLGGDGTAEKTSIFDRIEDDFGGFESWQEEFIACAKASEAWAVMGWDSITDRLYNYMADSDSIAVWAVVPLLVIDVAEHAYYYDQGPKKSAYIKAFLSNVNWKAIDKRYKVAVPE